MSAKNCIDWSTNPPSNIPPRNKALLLRAYEPLVSLNKILLNPYFWGWLRKGEVGWLAINILI